jgi:hypothetical protein
MVSQRLNREHVIGFVNETSRVELLGWKGAGKGEAGRGCRGGHFTMFDESLAITSMRLANPGGKSESGNIRMASPAVISVAGVPVTQGNARLEDGNEPGEPSAVLVGRGR